MSKPIIAIDLDDVLADSAAEFVTFGNKLLGVDLSVEDYNEHFATMWSVDEEEAEKIALEFHASGISAHYLHKEEAVEVLRNLAERYELVIMTSRRQVLEKMTLDWLDKHYKGIFSKVYFTGIWEGEGDNKASLTKASLCKEINAQFLIDDQPKHCLGVAEVGIETLLFGDYPWNRQIKDQPRVTRVASWPAVEEYFNAKS